MELENLLNNDLRKLRFINRYSGQFLVKNETNSDHVWEMISMALKLVPEWNKKLKQKLDIRDIVYRIAIHDLDECLTSDLPRPFKYYSEKFTKSIREVVDEITKKEFPEELYNDVKSSKDHSVNEGLVVSVLDMIQVSTKYIDEINNCGNNSVKVNLMSYNIESLTKLLNEISKSGNELHNLLSEFISKLLTELKMIQSK